MHIPQWLSEKLSIHDAIIKKAQQIQRIKDNTHMSTIQPQLTTYNVDQYVLIEYPSSTQHKGPPFKLLTNLRGPMKIIQKIDENHYKLLDLISNQEENVHIKRIHPFYFDPSIINPYEVAYKDQQQFKIQSILSHRGNRYEQKTMEFEVQWEPIGDNESVITWESYKSLRSTEALHHYLRQNKMKSLIPAIFRVNNP